MNSLPRLPQLSNALKFFYSQIQSSISAPLVAAQLTAASQCRWQHNRKRSKDNEWATIYRLPLSRLAAAFNRLKLYQGALTAVGTPISYSLEMSGKLPPEVTGTVIMVGVTGLITLTLASLVVKNLVGFIYINETGDMLKLAYVDFWGQRQHVLVSVDDVIPNWAQKKPSRVAFYQVIRFSSDERKKFKLLPQFGVIMQPQIYSSIFEE